MLIGIIRYIISALQAESACAGIEGKNGMLYLFSGDPMVPGVFEVDRKLSQKRKLSATEAERVWEEATQVSLFSATQSVPILLHKEEFLASCETTLGY